MKEKCKIFIGALIFIASFSAFSNQKIITALSWWNYLDKTWVKEAVMKDCKVKLAVQSYKDANEFNRSFELKDYDIAIFESTQLDSIENSEEASKISTLYKLSSNYFPALKQIFNDHIKVNNLAFFYISNTVFLYNPKNIALNSNDTITSIINKLNANKKNDAFILLDDPITINQIIKSEKNDTMNTQSFKKIFNYNNLVISNDYNNYEQLGVFITWSGEANYHKKKAEKNGVELKIITIPSYSYITADIIAQLNSSKQASCVASLIASKDFMERLQSETYYYSPYMTFSNIQDSTYKEMYHQFFDMMQNKKLKWLLPTKDELSTIQSSWEQIIFDYGL